MRILASLLANAGLRVKYSSKEITPQSYTCNQKFPPFKISIEYACKMGNTYEHHTHIWLQQLYTVKLHS